jgi:ferredoxin
MEGTMAEPLRANAFGRYYVTDDCDGCGVCVEVAPANFTFSPDGDYCAVYAQPSNEHEEDLLERVKEACPLQALKDDGDEL